MGFSYRIKNSNSGFTLIELLIVIVVIGVLASVVLIYVNPIVQFQRARDTQRKSSLRQIQSALEMYRSDTGGYPLTASGPVCGNTFSSGTVTYLSKVPCDPKGGSYVYKATDTMSYTLYACLENVNDAQKDTTNSCVLPYVSYTVSNP
jgi:general secretion pathway protein G